MNDKEEMEYYKLKLADLERKQNNKTNTNKKTNTTKKTNKHKNPMDVKVLIQGLREYWRGHLIAFASGIVFAIVIFS